MDLMDVFGNPEVFAVTEYFFTTLAFIRICCFILLNIVNIHIHGYLKPYPKDLKFRPMSGD